MGLGFYIGDGLRRRRPEAIVTRQLGIEWPRSTPRQGAFCRMGEGVKAAARAPISRLASSSPVRGRVRHSKDILPRGRRRPRVPAAIDRAAGETIEGIRKGNHRMPSPFSNGPAKGRERPGRGNAR